jgi:hypothetical protein
MKILSKGMPKMACFILSRNLLECAGTIIKLGFDDQVAKVAVANGELSNLNIQLLKN